MLYPLNSTPQVQPVKIHKKKNNGKKVNRRQRLLRQRNWKVKTKLKDILSYYGKLLWAVITMYWKNFEGLSQYNNVELVLFKRLQLKGNNKQSIWREAVNANLSLYFLLLGSSPLTVLPSTGHEIELIEKGERKIGKVKRK